MQFCFFLRFIGRRVVFLFTTAGGLLGDAWVAPSKSGTSRLAGASKE